MRDNFLHHLKSNKSYQLLQQLITVFYGFDLMLLTLEGQFIEPFVKSSVSSQSRVANNPQAFPPEKFSDLNLLQEIQESRQAKITVSEQGCKQFLVPVIQKKDVVGFIFVSEEISVRLTEAELQITLTFLTDYIRLLVKTDLEFVEYFQNMDMTHQQCIIHDVVRYIQDNYCNAHLTLRDVADWRGISYHYLSSLFKDTMKISFKDFLTQIRFDKAMRLLESKSLPVGQIAYQCGFDDPSYFSKAFKRKIGMSPLEYRDHQFFSKAKNKKSLEFASAR